MPHFSHVIFWMFVSVSVFGFTHMWDSLVLSREHRVDDIIFFKESATKTALLYKVSLDQIRAVI